MTLEEILEAIRKDSSLAVGILENIPNIDGGKQYIENANSVFFKSEIGGEISKIYNGIDNDLFDLTGKRKNSDEKTYDFLKKTVSDLLKKNKSLKGKTPEEITKLNETIEALELKVKNGESSSHWKTSYNELVEELRENKKSHENDLLKLNSSILASRLESDLSEGFVGLELNKDFPQSVLDSMVNQAKKGLVEHAKIVEGNVVYFDSKGKELMDKQYRPATANYLLKERLTDILKEGKTPGGGATSKKGEVVIVGEGDTSRKKLVLDKETFNTRQEFQTVAEKALLDKGITRENKEFNTLIDGAFTEYEVSELDIN